MRRSTVSSQLRTSVVSEHPDVKAGLDDLLVVVWQLHLVSVYLDLESFLCQKVLKYLIIKKNTLTSLPVS